MKAMTIIDTLTVVAVLIGLIITIITKGADYGTTSVIILLSVIARNVVSINEGKGE